MEFNGGFNQYRGEIKKKNPIIASQTVVLDLYLKLHNFRAAKYINEPLKLKITEGKYYLAYSMNWHA